jgi:hypothetical protein
MATYIERGYVVAAGIDSSKFSFVSSGFRNHNDEWILRPSVARSKAQAWLRQARGLGPAPPPPPLPPQTPASLCKPDQTPPSCYCPTFCPGGCCGQPPVPECTVETFRDDFNGSVLNVSKWTVLDQIHRGGVYTPDNVFVKDGALMLRSQAQEVTLGSEQFHVTSGAVNTSDKFEQQYGIFEISAMPYYCPSHTGPNASLPLYFMTGPPALHNTFWLYGFVEHRKNTSGIACNCPEEIDIWEAGNQQTLADVS